MARGVNKVIIVGNLGNDPEVRYMPNGGAVANVSVATTESWKDKQSGQKVDKTEWHRVVFYNKLAEIVGEYLKKGSQIYLEGRLQTRKWQNKEGVDQYTTEIVANEMQMLGGRGESGGSASFGSQSRGNDFGGANQQQRSAPQAAPAAAPADDFDDDIPF